MSALLSSIRYRFRTADALQRLIGFNVAVFAVIRIVHALSKLFLAPFWNQLSISHWLAVPANFGILIYKPWTLITYMFLHWDFMHILYNMLMLFWFGQIFKEYLGEKKLVATYLLGGIFGALAFLLAFSFFPLFEAQRLSAVALGASASVLAIAVAIATLLPDYQLSLLFFGPVRLKWIIIVILFLDLISVSSTNAGGHIAHLGGAAFGYLYIVLLRRGTDISAWLQRLLSSGSSSRMKTAYRSKQSSDEGFVAGKKQREERLDAILDKISKSGYGSLTKEERDFLFQASKDN